MLSSGGSLAGLMLLHLTSWFGLLRSNRQLWPELGRDLSNYSLRAPPRPPFPEPNCLQQHQYSSMILHALLLGAYPTSILYWTGPTTRGRFYCLGDRDAEPVWIDILLCGPLVRLGAVTR